MNSTVTLLIILVVNLIITLIYLAVNLALKRDRKGSVLLRCIVLLCIPFVGIVFLGLSHGIFKVFLRKPVSLADVIFSKERVETYSRAEEEWERDIVPIEEAIQVTDTGGLRNFMMSVVRGDIRQSLGSIMLALNSEDQETSHYAAAVLQDELNSFREGVKTAREKIFSGEEDSLLAASDLMDYMNLVLSQRILPELEQVSFVGVFNEICEYYYQHRMNQMTASEFEAISLRLLEIDDYPECTKWCERAKAQYPNTLTTYTTMLKLYFKSGQKERFFKTMEELKTSAIVLDSETLELIRVFQ